MGQEYLPNRVGTASGVTLGLAVTAGGLAAPVLGAIADRWGLSAPLMIVAILPLLAVALVLTLPDSRERPSPDPGPGQGDRTRSAPASQMSAWGSTRRR